MIKRIAIFSALFGLILYAPSAHASWEEMSSKWQYVSQQDPIDDSVLTFSIIAIGDQFRHPGSVAFGCMSHGFGLSVSRKGIIYEEVRIRFTYRIDKDIPKEKLLIWDGKQGILDAPEAIEVAKDMLSAKERIALKLGDEGAEIVPIEGIETIQEVLNDCSK